MQDASRSGSSLVEVIVAMGILTVIAAGFVRLSIGSFGLHRRAWEDTTAANYAEEGLEASRSVAERNYNELTLGSHGLSSATGRYAFTGTLNILGAYTRVVTVAGVERDGSDSIVQSGGTDDPDTRLVTSTVTWNPAQGPAHTVKLTTYLTRWKLLRWVSDLVSTFQGYYRNSTQVTTQVIPPGTVVEDRCTFRELSLSPDSPEVEHVHCDRNGNITWDAGLGHYWFIYRLDSTAPAPGCQDGDGTGGPQQGMNHYNLPGDGTYTVRICTNVPYVLATNNGRAFSICIGNSCVGNGGIELLVAAPIETLAPFLTRNFTGEQNVNEVAVDVIRDRLYMALQNKEGADPEFLSLDISNVSRLSLSQSGALDLGEGSNGFAIGRNYAYVLTDDSAKEVLVVRLRDFQIVATWDLDVPENSGDPLDAVLDEAAKRLYVGRRKQGSGDEFYVLSTENPEGALAIVSHASIGNDPNGVAIRGNFAYLATERNDGELFTVNLSTMSIVRCDLAGNQDAVEIQIVGDRLFIARNEGPNPEFAEYAINPSDPGSCAGIATLIGSTELGADDVLAMSVLPSEGYAIFAMNASDKEIRLVKLSNFQEVGNRDLVGDKCDAITFFGGYLYAGCRDDTSTLQMIEGTAVRAYRGTVTSLPFDSGAAGTAWRRVGWTVSGSGSVSLRLRTAGTEQNLKQAQWVGADGTTATVYANGAGETIVTDPLSSGTRFIQWKAALSANGTTPIVEDVTITYP